MRWNFSFTALKFLLRKKIVEIFHEAKRVSWNIIQFVHTIKFHLYDRNNVSLIERINNFHFSCHRYYSFYIVFENTEKALIIMLLAIGVKLDGEDEQVKKREKRSVWMKSWLKICLRTSADQNIFQELRLKDKGGTST